MDDLTGVKADFITRCAQVLGDKGRLSTAIPGFHSRAEQVVLASEIAKAIQKPAHLIAEAGTGTGKTYAYLVPALLSNKKILLSTATKTLQDQLFHKDLPTLLRALALPSRIQNLKGRANYLCRYRIELHTEEGRFTSPTIASELAHIRNKLPQLTRGENSELPEIPEDSMVWPYATSTTDNCLGADCPQKQDCFLLKARKEALEAQVVVINHHLFFADSRLREEGFAELLPEFEVIVFDEAHQLAEVASAFFGQRLSTRQLRELLHDIVTEWPALDLANQPLKRLHVELEQVLQQLQTALPADAERFSLEKLRSGSDFQENLLILIERLTEVLHCFDSIEIEASLDRCKTRLLTFMQFFEEFRQNKSNHILWLEQFKQSLVFYATPYEVSKAFKNLMDKQKASFIFTSATLSTANSFDCFTKPLGLQGLKTLLLPSPFDFKTQALLYLPRGMPDPKQQSYNEQLLTKVLPLIKACGGRCFILFTSHKALQQMASLLAMHIEYPLLVQGEEAKAILLSRFRQLGNAVLLGTATFWEGVDVKGEALSCVIIDKIPFASPTDPVIYGKMAYLKKQGLSGFDEISLPNAILALKQGVGRLIRDASDRGVMVLADPRLTGRNYGKQIFASLPQMHKTRDEEKVLEFIKQLALTDESTSD